MAGNEIKTEETDMYKIETHLHTARCSHCGRLSAREIV